MANKEQIDPSEYEPGKVTITRQEYDELTQTKKFIDGEEIAKVINSLEEIIRVMRTWSNGFK